MSQFIWLLISITTAICTGLLVKKLKVPGGMLVGALLGVALLQITTNSVVTLPGIKDISQIISGVFVGAALSVNDLKRLPRLWKGFIVIIIGLVFLNLLNGYLITRFSDIPPITALFASIPGGMSSIPIISADYGADPITVSVVQFLRMMMGVGVFPTVADKLSDRIEANSDLLDDDKPKGLAPIIQQHRQIPKYTALVIVTFASIFLSRYITGLTYLTLAILITLVLKLSFGVEKLPSWTRQVAQVFSGWYIGSLFGYEQFLRLIDLIIPVIIVIFVYLIGCLTIGFFVHKVQKLPIKDAMLASLPAGASDMVLIMDDLKVENYDIVIYQVLRLLVVTTFFPEMALFIASILN